MPSGAGLKPTIVAYYSLYVSLFSLTIFTLAVITQLFIWPFFNLIPEQHDDTAMSIFSLPNLLWALIALSGFVVVAALFSCICAFKWSAFITFCVIFIITPALIGEHVVLKRCFDGKEKAIEQMKFNLNDSLNYYHNSTNVVLFWDTIQSEVKCCGFTGPDDWVDINNSTTLPLSCCNSHVSNNTCSINGTNVYIEGCWHEFDNQIQKQTIVSVTVSIVIIVTEIITVLFCAFLCCCCGSSHIVFRSDYIPL